ncbi:hypothetical protein AAHA92_02650 [Salvia divinorum]|uniref:Uncharacterized protein n=1 Tax=Salvia divinorum TaxID=28513 RepID=A0ABD1IEL2_SALDI
MWMQTSYVFDHFRLRSSLCFATANVQGCREKLERRSTMSSFSKSKRFRNLKTSFRSSRIGLLIDEARESFQVAPVPSFA